MRQRLAWERGRFRLIWGAAKAVRERGRFLRHESASRVTVREYGLRDSPYRAVLRQPFTDMTVLREVFTLGGYDPPAEVSLRSPLRVLDLGGHVGLFGLHVHTRYDAQVTSFEPDPHSLPLLRRCIEINDLGQRWEVVPAAAGSASETAEFISDFSRSQVASAGAHLPWETWIPKERKPKHLEPSMVTVPVVDSLPYMQACDLLKVDIEGAEWALLSDPRFAETSAQAIVMETHPSTRAPEAEEHLARAGFDTVQRVNVDGATEMLWAVRARSA